MGLLLHLVCAFAGAQFPVEQVHLPLPFRAGSSFRMIPHMHIPESAGSSPTEGEETRQTQRAVAGAIAIGLGVAAVAVRWKREECGKQNRQPPSPLDYQRSAPGFHRRRRVGALKPAARAPPENLVAARAGNFHFAFTSTLVNQKQVDSAKDGDDVLSTTTAESIKGTP
jgi:hypothetical protein